MTNKLNYPWPISYFIFGKKLLISDRDYFWWIIPLLYIHFSTYHHLISSPILIFYTPRTGELKLLKFFISFICVSLILAISCFSLFPPTFIWLNLHNFPTYFTIYSLPICSFQSWSIPKSFWTPVEVYREQVAANHTVFGVTPHYWVFGVLTKKVIFYLFLEMFEAFITMKTAAAMWMFAVSISELSLTLQ